MIFMNSYQNPVTPPDPYDRYRIEPVGEDKREKERGYGGGGEPPDEKYGLFAQLLKTLYQMVTGLLRGERRAEKRDTASLRSLKMAFETLKREDRSEDIAFLHHLSQTWLHLVEEGIQQAKELKELIQKIERYPENQAHTFGYYLSEFAGQKWIPFPYMELIQQIHAEHQKYPEISALTEWTRLLDDLLLQVE